KRKTVSTKMASKQFALVWWLQSKETSIIPLTSVLPKKNRSVNSIVKLQWKGQSKMLQAKIIAINGNQAEKNPGQHQGSSRLNLSLGPSKLAKEQQTLKQQI
ncbi:hypothetical protein PV328_011852, partial [Microctonus aethiopoides]